MGLFEIALTSSINFYLFGVLSIIFNATLIYVLLKRSLTPIGTYKYLMIASSLLDALLSFTSIFALPVLLIIGNGFILPRRLTVIAVILSLLLLYQSILIPPCLFIFRYLQICRYDSVAMNISCYPPYPLINHHRV
uniref:G_PROTEIN_RECEP_F1_2 domain-containing protein n=1 Tax=Angiostrongylus cantonensis TaxID=6313 RepID=A0A0K0DKX7_ANGCA